MKIQRENCSLIKFDLQTGFLSTSDHVASGNWGLHDQKLVIEWVRANIETFSGDSNSITIFGQGAGAASVVYHLVSPLTNGIVCH